MRIRIPIHPVFLEKADKKPIKADREKLILEYVSEHGSIGNSEARELLGLAESMVKRLLTDMAKREFDKYRNQIASGENVNYAMYVACY